MTRATLSLAVSLVGLVAACSGPGDAPPISSAPPPASTGAAPDASATSVTPTPSDLPPLTTSDGGVPPAGGACAPATAVTPAAKPWKVPHALRRGVCSWQEAKTLAECFVSQQNCNVYISQPCHSCAVSGDATPFSAALIVSQQGQPAELNVEGCVAALTGDTSAAGCGPKLQARFECASQACASCTDQAQRTTCLQQADTGVCATHSQAASCATPYLSQCVQGASELEVAFNLVNIFCGP